MIGRNQAKIKQVTDSTEASNEEEVKSSSESDFKFSDLFDNAEIFSIVNESDFKQLLDQSPISQELLDKIKAEHQNNEVQSNMG